MAVVSHPVGTVSINTPESWLAAAGGRPEWMLWGKAQPQSSCPAHPLLCHMLDVAAVASRMLATTLPPALRTRVLRPFGNPDDAERYVLYLIALHDIGKATPAFQEKVDWAVRLLPPLALDLCADASSRNHGDIGLYLLHRVLEAQGTNGERALALARAVCAHHGQFPTDFVALNPPGSREKGRNPAWDQSREGIVTALANLFGVNGIPGSIATDHAYVVLLAGMTSVADWIGSMQEVFSYEPPQSSLMDYWGLALDRADHALARVGMRPLRPMPQRSFKELFPHYRPWPLHEAADTLSTSMNQPSLVIVEAPMGEGKTEAALLLAEAAAVRLGQHGFYIGLPTQATANNMFDRVTAFLRRVRGEHPSSVVLAHSEARLVESYGRLRVSGIYDEGAGNAATERGDNDRCSGSVRAESWFQSRKRALLAEFGVGTIDQTLHAVMRVPHGFVRIYALAGKVVILDEVHAYDTFTGTLLDRLIEWLAATGTTVLLLSATLPAARRAQLLEAYRRGARLPAAAAAEAPYPRISSTSAAGVDVVRVRPRGASRTIALQRAEDDIESLAQTVATHVRAGGCIGWICNTVQRAQDAAVAVRSLLPDLGDRLLLLHSRLFPEDRQTRERTLTRWLGPESTARERPRSALVIGTQVLEQSLDVDFDVLVSDIAPIDLVLQRAGRLWRHERGNRSTAVRAPTLVLACPRGKAASAPLDAVAKVYAQLLVRRTLKLLEGRSSFMLPDDIEAFVNNVYSDTAVPPDDELYGAYLEHHGGKANSRSIAEQKLMPHPYVRDDPFGDLRVYLEDGDDPVLHQQLRADTRLGPPTVEVVCLVRRGSKLFAGDEGTVDLAAEPDWRETQRLIRQSIGISHRRIVPLLKNSRGATPDSWRRSSLLRYRRVLVFDDGRTTLGRYNLRLDAELGLRITATSGDDDDHE